MSDAKAKWQRQEQAVRATQMAFDLSSEVQKSIKKQAKIGRASCRERV